MKALLLFPNTLWSLFLNPWRLRAAFVLLLWGSLAAATHAKTKGWDKAYYFRGELSLSAMVVSPEWGYLLAGTLTDTFQTDDFQKQYVNAGLARKVSANGTGAWEKFYRNRGDDHLNAAVATADGGYLLGGSTRKPAANDNKEGDTDFWLVKTDAEGIEVWSKTFSGSGEDAVTSLLVTPDGGYLIGGTSASATGGDKSEASRGKTDYWIIKTDKNGKKLWDKTIGSSKSDALVSMLTTPDGGYLLGGTSASGVSGDKTDKGQWDEGFWIVRIDSKGTKLWDKFFDGTSGVSLGAMLTTPDSGFLLGGSGYSEKYSAERQGTNDYYVVKTDRSGNQVWDAYYGGDGWETLTALASTPGNSYLLGGFSDAIKGGDVTQARRGDYDYWVVRIDSAGQIFGDKRFGGKASDKLSALVVMKEEYLLGGVSLSGISGNKTSERRTPSWWLVSTTPIRWKQTITFDPIPGKTPGDAPFALPARASSGLPVHFEVRGPATIADSILTITGEGAITIYASQPGNDLYDAAPTVVRSFVVRPPSAFTQITWDKAYHFDDESSLNAMIAATDGGYLLVGSTAPMNVSQNSYGVAARIDTSGNKVWEQSYYAYGDDRLVAAIATSDGGYLLGGTAHESGDLEYPDGPPGADEDYWIVKVDKDGNKVWSRTYGGAKNDYLSAILATSNGGYLLGGTSSSGISGDKTQASQGAGDQWIIKIDAAGNKVWDKTFGGSGLDGLSTLAPAPDGGYLLGGSSSSGISGDKTQASQGGIDYWIVKTDANGNKVWDKTFGGSEDDGLAALIATADGGYLLGGTSSSGISGHKTQASRGKSDYWIVKTDANGNKVWDKTFGGSEDDGLAALIATADGGYLLGGSSESGISGDKTEANRTGTDFWPLSDYWIVKTNKSGNKVWDKRFGGDDMDDFGDMLATPDGGYLLGGSSYSGISGDKTEALEPDFWVIKVKDISISPTPPAPALTAVSPRAALPGDTITIRGAHLLATSAVRFNGEEATFSIRSDSSLTAVVPLTASSGKIEVRTPGGKAASADAFLVLQPAIVVFAPDRGYPGARVLLYGRYLATAREVRFNGVPAQDFTVYNDFFILAWVPEGATSGKISLTLRGGAEATSSWTYRVLQRTAAQVIAAAEAASAVAAEQTGAYPNPFTAGVTIPVLLEKSSPVRLIIYTSTGQQVSELTFGELPAGTHLLEWNGADSHGNPVKEGLYTYKVTANDTTTSGKLLKALDR